jgi:pimeloyl-ACP methyl ester carboxylesterase
MTSRGGHPVYYEVHGDGPRTALCMGGWGTFCHGGTAEVPRLLTRRFRVVVFDYRGIGDTPRTTGPLTTALLAADAAAVLDEVGTGPVDVVGLVGLGACVGQELALGRPDLVASLVMTGTWAAVDPTFADQLELFRQVHQGLGFAAFQTLCAAYSFDPDFYAHNRDRVLGPAGAWAALRGRPEAHGDLVRACLAHDTRDRLHRITVPTLVLHAGADVITAPRLTRPLEHGIPGARGVLWPDLAHIIAGREQRARFDDLLSDFYGLGSAT